MPIKQHEVAESWSSAYRVSMWKLGRNEAFASLSIADRREAFEAKMKEFDNGKFYTQYKEWGPKIFPFVLPPDRFAEGFLDKPWEMLVEKQP